MKKILLLLCLPLLLSCAMAGFESQKDNFKIAFPAEPTEQSQVLDILHHKVDMRMYIDEDAAENSYIVGVMIFPPGFISPKDDMDAALKSLVKGFIPGFGGVVTSDREMSIGTRKWREFTSLLDEEGVTSLGRACIDNGKAYFVLSFQPKEKPDREAMRRFLDSFEFIK